MTVETITLTTAIIGAVCGVTGVVLGILNTWRQMQRDRVWLRVSPQNSFTPGAESGIDFSIEVTNLSEFALVVDEVGFFLRNGGKVPIMSLKGLDLDGPLSRRLEPRTRYLKCFRFDDLGEFRGKIKTAYARTQCGTHVKGTSPALKGRIREGRAHA